MQDSNAIEGIKKIVETVKDSLIPIQEITITRQEGPSHKCGIPEKFDKLFKADSYAFCESSYAPELGYDKFSVKVVWQDGREFNFRLDITKFKGFDNNVSTAFRSIKKYYLDKELPEQITNDKIFKLSRQNIKELYEGYEIGIY